MDSQGVPNAPAGLTQERGKEVLSVLDQVESSLTSGDTLQSFNEEQVAHYVDNLTSVLQRDESQDMFLHDDIDFSLLRDFPDSYQAPQEFPNAHAAQEKGKEVSSVVDQVESSLMNDDTLQSFNEEQVVHYMDNLTSVLHQGFPNAHAAQEKGKEVSSIVDQVEISLMNDDTLQSFNEEQVAHYVDNLTSVLQQDESQDMFLHDDIDFSVLRYFPDSDQAPQGFPNAHDQYCNKMNRKICSCMMILTFLYYGTSRTVIRLLKGFLMHMMDNLTSVLHQGFPNAHAC